MKRRYGRRKFFDEPNMSDKALLVSVEDLICTAFGPTMKNTVNFKLVQTILHILARQLRLLEQDVEIKLDDIGDDFETGIPHHDDDEKYSDDESSYSSSSAESKEGRRGAGQHTVKKGGEKEKDEKEEKEEKKKKQGEEGKKKEGPEKGEKGKRREQGELREQGEREEKGEQKGKRSKDRKSGSKDRGASSSSRGRKGEDDEDEGEGRDGKRHGGRRRRGEDAEDEGGERDDTGRRRDERRRRGEDGEDEGGKRDDHGRRRGRQHRRGEDGEDEGGERDGHGRRHGGRGRRGDDDGDEGDERGGRNRGGRDRGGRSRERDRQDRKDGERRVDRPGGRGGEYNDDDDQRRRRKDGRRGSGTSITVTEAARGGPGGTDKVLIAERGPATHAARGGPGGTDKVLIAERGPATHGRVARVGSIEVVTASQFELLARAVKQLEQVTGPPPMPSLPANKQLREDLVKRRASLSDTMEAVQLSARVQAAEEGLSRMAGLLTQLTAAGALPMDFASRIGDLNAELRKSTMTAALSRRDFPEPGTRAAGPGSKAVSTLFAEDAEYDDSEDGLEQQKGRSEGFGLKSAEQSTAAEAEPLTYDDMPVTHIEMQDILEKIKATIAKEIQTMTARANHSADIASNTSRNVSDKLAIALSIDERITTLYSQTADYAEQLNGFDTGLTTQMASFQEQMGMMRADLKGGLEMLESANNNAETAAIQDLSERYETLVLELENTVHLHTNLSMVQQQIGEELKSLVECVEMLREQKADRDEVLDGLRDKADMSRLAGLLYEKDFAQARFEIEKRIEKSYTKFMKQDELWQSAMTDLTRILDQKAELLALIAFKDKATKDLNSIQQKQHQLEVILGEPQAALLTRKLAAGAACGACLTPALMPMADATHGKPALLPALRPSPLGAEGPCEIVLRPPDTRNHICHRWVGGSHTLMAGNVSREKAAQSHLETIPTKKYEGYGTDGKLYMLEEEMLPCGECNMGHSPTPTGGTHSPTPTGGTHSPTPTGGGDRA